MTLPRPVTAILSILVAVQTVAAAQVYRFGTLSETLTPEAVLAMSRAAGSFWAVYGLSQPISVEGKATVFLKPTKSMPRLRRGAARTVRCPSETRLGSCVTWELSGPESTYVQVADRSPFGQSLWPRTIHERPICIVGDFPDSDLLGLVAYVRSKPTAENDSGFQSGMIEDDPIMSIERGPGPLVTVTMSSNGMRGSRATLRKHGQSWHLVEVGPWIA